MMLVTCAGTLGTAKRCVRLSEHRRSIACETNSSCYQDTVISVVQVYGKQALSADSDMSGSKEVVEASKVFMKNMAALTSRSRVVSWTVPPGLVSV